MACEMTKIANLVCILRSVLFFLSVPTHSAIEELIIPETMFQEGGILEKVLHPNQTARMRIYTTKFLQGGKKFGELCSTHDHTFIRKEQNNANRLINDATGEDEEAEKIAVKLRHVLNLTLTHPNYCSFNPFWSHNDTDLCCANNSTCLRRPCSTAISVVSAVESKVLLDMILALSTGTSGADSRYNCNSIHLSIPLVVLLCNFITFRNTE